MTMIEDMVENVVETEDEIIITNENKWLRPKGSQLRTKEEIANIFSERGYSLEMNQEINSSRKLLAYDSEGYKLEVMVHRLLEGRTPHIISPNNPYTIWNIKNVWLPKNAPEYELLSNKYEGNKVKLEWRLKNSDLPTFKMIWNSFQRKRQHPILNTIKGEQMRRVSWKELKEEIDIKLNSEWKSRRLQLVVEDDYEIVDFATDIVFFRDNRGYIYCNTIRQLRNGYSPKRYSVRFPQVSSYNLSVWNNNYNKNEIMLETTYKGDGKYEFICETHGAFTKHLHDAFAGVKCRQCEIDNRKGENHPLWDSSISEEDRDDKRISSEYRKWRKDVYERYDYTCVVCSSDENIAAHHLDGFNWCVEGRTDINNGVTLCKECHKDFHKVYGNGNNTKEQFKEWRDDLCANNANE